jgi:hypothetical protein
LRWVDENLLELLVVLVDDDIEARWSRSPDDLSTLGALVIQDIYKLEQTSPSESVSVQLHFVRFHLSTAVAEHSLMHGRASLAFDWLVCSVTKAPFKSWTSGVAVETFYNLEWLPAFVSSSHPSIALRGRERVLVWLRELYYYSWKFAGLRPVAAAAVSFAWSLISDTVESGDADLKLLAIEAVAQLATWTDQAKRPDAVEIVSYLASLYERPDVPPRGKMIVALVLMSAPGRNAGQPLSAWADRLLQEHGALLGQHERVQALVASCATSAEAVGRYAEILSAVEDYVRDSASQMGRDSGARAFRRAQLFDVIAPIVRALLDMGLCQKAVDLTAAWFAVPRDKRRSSPTLALVPNHEHGVLYVLEGVAQLFERDTRAAQTRLLDAANRALGTSVFPRDDHTWEPRVGIETRECGAEGGAEFFAASMDFYRTESLRTFLASAGIRPTALFHVHATQVPVQALLLSTLDETWPIVASFEEPLVDRPLRRALIWTRGTLLGETEATAVAAILTASGVQCTLLVEQDLTPEDFKRLYADEAFDAFWVAAHGEFKWDEPHRASVTLSADGTQSIALSDLIAEPVPGPARRLLLLNICSGGTVMVSEAPGRLGLGAMLARSNQAVVGHLWGVGNYAAPLFGAVTAIGAAKGRGFFSSFVDGCRALRMERSSILALLRDQNADLRELVQRFENTTDGSAADDICTWGMPVFYE